MKNNGSIRYKNIYVGCVYAEDSSGHDFWPSCGSSTQIALDPGATGMVTRDFSVPIDQATGSYTLSYYIEFRDEEGRTFRTDTYSTTIHIT